MADSKGLMTLVLASLSLLALGREGRLINGKEVTPGTYKEVIQVKSNGSTCTATVVGPRVIATAAHCAANGATATFSVGGDSYSATMYRSTLYPKQDHDIALGVTTKDITGVDPVSIGGAASKGLRITLLGYGCTQVQGGPTDGKLRYGDTLVTDTFDFFMKSYESPNGAALCFGDSGGPAFVTDNGKRLLLGINSKGNISDTNYHTRTDMQESKAFFNSVATSASVEICGVNKNCNGSVPSAPTCTMNAVPGTVTQGQSLALNIVVQGSATTASIDGSPVVLAGGTGTKTINANTVGTFTAMGVVQGPGGTSNCSANYSVLPATQPNAPTCSIALNPAMITLGQSSTATLTVTSGSATTVTLDGQSLSSNGGSLTVTPTVAGMKMLNGFVSGTGGSNSCSASLQVSPGGDPISNFTLVPTHCGPNTLGGPVKEVCLAVISFSYAKRDLSFKEAIIIENADGTKEMEPIILRQLGRKRANSAEVYEELTYYANTMTEDNGKYQMKIQRGLLKTNPQGQAQTIQGHSPGDNFFLVQKLTPVVP